MSGIRRTRPGLAALAAMIVLNGVAAYWVITLAFALFGVHWVLPGALGSAATIAAVKNWSVVGPMVPGAAVGFSFLWFWLILVGRSRGIAWNTAVLYGIGIALADVLAGGLLAGIENGNPLLGLLIGFVMLLIVPAIWASMATAGILLGLLNAHLAQNWIDRHGAA